MADAVKVIDSAIAAFGAEPVAWQWEYRDKRHVTNDQRRAKIVAEDGEVLVQPLYTAPQTAPVVSDIDTIALNTARNVMYDINRMEGWPGGDVQLLAHIQSRIEQACRADMLQAGNSPVIPDGYVLVPKKLTAENGAKSVLSGEFSETKFINCPECFGDDDCETCDGSGRIEITVPVTWTTIKAIWAKGVEHFAAAPQQE
ncbi:TPA: hypothetical protein ACUB0U_000242 [Citrobacter freundii]